MKAIVFWGTRFCYNTGEKAGITHGQFKYMWHDVGIMLTMLRRIFLFLGAKFYKKSITLVASTRKYFSILSSLGTWGAPGAPVQANCLLRG